MSSLQSLIKDYVDGIIRKSQGMMNPLEAYKFYESRKVIKQGLNTYQWFVMGLHSYIINVLMQNGDMFLNEKPMIALELYREAGSLFPRSAICYIREAQCHILMKCFDQAQKTCEKAISHSCEHNIDQLLSLLDMFVGYDRLQEAHNLCRTLMFKFSRFHNFRMKVKELEILLRIKKEDEQKTRVEKQKKNNPCMAPSESTATAAKTACRTTNEVVKASRQAKAVKISKRPLKREQIARKKPEMEKEIERARKRQEEIFKKEKEVKARKKEEQEEKERKLRKQEAHEQRSHSSWKFSQIFSAFMGVVLVITRLLCNLLKRLLSSSFQPPSPYRNKDREISCESAAHERKESEKHQQNLVRQKNDEIQKQQEQMNERVKTKSSNSSNEVKANGLITLLDGMPENFDQVLSSGSRLRRVCPTCNIPRAFSSQICSSCKSRLVIWYKNVNRSNWTNPRKPPKGVTKGFEQCKGFEQGNKCVETQCTFAHGQDELEIWKLYYKKGKKQAKLKTDTTTAEAKDLEDHSRDKDLKHKTSVSSLPTSSSSTTLSGHDPGHSSKSLSSYDEFTDTTSSVMEQENLKCNFCDVQFSSVSELKCHNSDPEHKVNVMKTTQHLDSKSPTKHRPPPDEVYKDEYKLCPRFEQGHCHFGNKCTFAHGREERDYWITLYQRQSQHLSQLRQEQLLTESFSEKIRRRIECGEEHEVLKEDLPGVTINCSPQWNVRLKGPQDHVWTINVQIQTKYRLRLSQVSFLYETHLDKFKFLRSSGEHSVNSARLLEEDFVVDKQKSSIQFSIQFSSNVFGDFEQKLVFDFGHESPVLARSLFASVVSKDICNSKEDSSAHTSSCRILEWSVEEMELVHCKDFIGRGGVCERYSMPNVLPNPAEFVGIARETYCKLWHDALFIEEENIEREVVRFDIQDGKMKVLRSFRNAVDEFEFAQSGEFFGEIYLSDNLVMDEVAGNLINRSVMTVILRPKLEQTPSNRVYECDIKLKTPKLVVIKLNEVLCKDSVFEEDQIINIDLKFRYNRLPICEMHQAIDMCQQKIEILLPNVKNISYKHKKQIHHFFMGKKSNTNQNEAIAMILDPKPTPPILVIGPFGTGKTFTLSLACLSILSQSRRKILICTHTNSAADIHLEHLDAEIEAKSRTKQSFNVRPLRIHDLHVMVRRVPIKLKKYCVIEETTNVIREPTWNEIRDHNVIITTMTTARKLWKFYQDGRLRFTHILIDEAAQALEPECVTPLVMADEHTKIVLAGDHMQMGTPVHSKRLWAERNFDPTKSLLERLFAHYKSIQRNQKSLSDKNRPPYVVLLCENYRCHADILKFPSDCFYGGKLLAKGDQSTLDFPPVLSFYAAQGMDKQVEGRLTYYNEAEVAEVVKRVKELTDLWPEDWGEINIGVLTPYQGQVERIRQGLRKKKLGYISVEKVENVQGKEFKALFVSTVRTTWTCSEIEKRSADPSLLDFKFLSDSRFLNTAMTRAQSLLSVVGDPLSLCSMGACKSLWKDYLRRCDANKGLYGCTLRTIINSCIRSQPLNPNAHEFTPGKKVVVHETLISTSSEATAEKKEGKDDDDDDDWKTSLSATDDFFRQDSTENFDEIKEELIKACLEMQSKEDEGANSQEELLKLLKENPTLYTKCTFRVDTSSRQRKYYGQLPTPDSPDIQISWCVREVFEDDIVVLELPPSARVRGIEGQDEEFTESDIVENIQDVLRKPIDPKERQFVCTVNQIKPTVMIPINKSLPRLANFVDKYKSIFPIYTLDDGKVRHARNLTKEHYGEALAGERVFVVKYLKWRPEFSYPLGLAIQHIPCGRDFNTGMDVFYKECNIRRVFRSELSTSITRKFTKNWQIPTNEKCRPAYRDNVFTIDPPDSLDLDDAISVRSLGNGNYVVHIHIADVSYFVQPNTDLDEEARLRGTSYYPPKPEKTVPMLPRELSEDCCSLLQGKDRLAVTVTVELKPGGKDVSYDDARIERSVVRSSARLNYHQAQQIINETSQHDLETNLQDLSREERQMPVEEAIGVIHRFAQGHRRSRLGVKRSTYHRNRDDCVDDREAHEMIEEMMIIANHVVAKYLLKKFPQRTPLCVQPPPKTHRVEEWKNRYQEFLHLSPGLKWLEDTEVVQDETVELKVPYKTWCNIMSKVEQDSSFQELAKHVCDLDRFPQLASANVHLRQLQQRGQYICSGETFENIPFPWPQTPKDISTENENVLQSVPTENTSLSDDHPDVTSSSSRTAKTAQDIPQQEVNGKNAETDYTDEQPASSSAYLNEDAQPSSNLPDDQNLKNILFGHWDLCLDAYCHFTSPIRRYIDIIVHRLVVAGIEDRDSTMRPDDITTLCDRCTFIGRNSARFDKETKKFLLALKLQRSLKFESVFIEKITPDGNLVLFFDTEQFQSLPGKSVRIAWLGPDKDPVGADSHKTLQWTFQFLRLDKHERAQLKPDLSHNRILQELAKKLERQIENVPTNLSEVLDDDFDRTVSCEQWIGVSEAVINRNKDELVYRLQEINNIVENQSKPESCTKISPLRRLKKDQDLSFDEPGQHVNADKQELSELETDEFLVVTKSFEPFNRAKVQICSHISGGVLSPTIQLFKLTDTIHACVEHRSSPTTCFAKIWHKRPAKVSKISEYVQYWKPVLMLEIATSAVRQNDVIILSNLFVSLEQDFKGDIKKKEEKNRKQLKSNVEEGDEYRSVVAQLIYSSTPVPESLITQRLCYVTAELILINLPNRRRLKALVSSEDGNELVKEICTRKLPTETDAESNSLPPELSLCRVDSTLSNYFYPLNEYQEDAVNKALTKPFSLIQGPPGTGKTVTGVHIAYWFAQKYKNSMVFYCGPSNKSVDVVAGLLIKIPDLHGKILRIYGQETEHKVFPVPDKITLFRSTRDAVEADEKLKDISLHNVIRSAGCPYAEELKEYDKEFKKYMKKNCNALREAIVGYKKKKRSAEEWAITKTGVKVILLTCTAAYSPRIMKPCKRFERRCIIDESAMCIEADTLCAMLGSNAKQVVLIGDHKQLQPIIQCNKAKKRGLGISMFERFAKREHLLTMLQRQYRMHKELCQLPSKLFYEEKLETADKVLNRTPDKIQWPGWNIYPFQFYHVEGTEKSLIVSTKQGNENSKKNEEEIAKVIYIARKLINEGVRGEDIVILSPYRAQCFEINKELKQHGLNHISPAVSVVQAQGSEKDYVILSLVRSLPKRKIERNPSREWRTENLGFITDEHQINVALTRAKRGLFIIGNANLIRVCKMWKDLLEDYESKGRLVDAK